MLIAYNADEQKLSRISESIQKHGTFCHFTLCTAHPPTSAGDKNASAGANSSNNNSTSRYGCGGKKNSVHIIRVSSLRKGDNRTPASAIMGAFGADGPKKPVIVTPAPPPSSLAVAAITSSAAQGESFLRLLRDL